jgi:hypothetical protein
VEELDLESIISASDDAEKRKTLEEELASLRGELSSVSTLMDSTYAVLRAGGPPEFVAGKLNELSANQLELKARLTSKEAEQRDFNARDSRFYTSREEIKDLVSNLQKPPTGELYKVRAQIASRLKVLVETLLVAPLGERPKMRSSIEQLRTTDDAGDVIDYMEQLAAHPDQSRRYFVVGFRDAAMRAVFPVYGDPLRFEQQVVVSEKWGLEVLEADVAAEQVFVRRI